MKELEFTKDGEKDVWVAKTIVTNDFAVRVVRPTPSRIVIGISSVEPIDDNDYAPAWDKNETAIFDHDFDAKVYPKYLRIESHSEALRGYIKEMED